MKVKKLDKNQCSSLVVEEKLCGRTLSVVVLSRYGLSVCVRDILCIPSIVSDIRWYQHM